MVEGRGPGIYRLLRGMGIGRWGHAVSPRQGRQAGAERTAIAALHLDGLEGDGHIHRTAGDFYRRGRYVSESRNGYLPNVWNGVELDTAIRSSNQDVHGRRKYFLCRGLDAQKRQLHQYAEKFQPVAGVARIQWARSCCTECRCILGSCVADAR